MSFSWCRRRPAPARPPWCARFCAPPGGRPRPANIRSATPPGRRGRARCTAATTSSSRPEDFGALIAADNFLEWADVYGKRYGTSRGVVAELRAGGFDVLLDIDVQGAHPGQAAAARGPPDFRVAAVLPGARAPAAGPPAPTARSRSSGGCGSPARRRRGSNATTMLSSTRIWSPPPTRWRPSSSPGASNAPAWPTRSARFSPPSRKAPCRSFRHLHPG